jgi:adenine specific DNA methylase Mod
VAVRLEWEGKPKQVERLSLPFQTVETINESRATRERDAGSLLRAEAREGADRNQLIWGDNKLVMSSLLKDFAGRVDLVYIDPPFDTGADFSMRVDVGGTDVTKKPSVLEEHAYRDTWGAGYDSYLSMMYPRLILVHDLLSEDGSLYLHCAPTVSHTLRLLCDEIFGGENFRNEIVWKRTSAHSSANRYGPVHDTILYYSKGPAPVWNGPREGYEQAYLDKYYRFDDGDGRLYWRADLCAAGTRTGRSGVPWRGINPAAKGMHWKFTIDRLDELDAEGRIYWPPRGTMPQYKRYRDELKGKAVSDVWTDLDRINPVGHERLGYPTQKPESLLTRIIEASSNEGDLVADFFVGSGTTVAIAETLGRRWIGCDLGRFAIHTGVAPLE